MPVSRELPLRMNGLAGKHWWSWQRLVVAALTAAGLAYVFSRIDLANLRSSLLRMEPGWFIAAFALQGLTLACGGLRWHMALRAIRCAVHPGAAMRLTVIGQYFFLMFLGTAAGEIAKAALYSRWFRFGLPELTASSPIDRALGVVGMVLVGGAAIAVGLWNGGFQQLGRAPIHISGVWMAIAAVVIVATFLVLMHWRPSSDSWWARAWRTLRSGLGRLATTPADAALAIGLAILTQLALAAIFALSLRAVSGPQLPWLQLLWTFPAIMMLSCIPITVAGAGVREMLSLTFLGLYGVPPADCVAAAILAFICKTGWSLIGGLVLARDSRRRMQLPEAEPTRISVVIPTLNEAEALPETIRRLRMNSSVHEVIVVDGGSSDGTTAVAEQLNCRVLTAPAGRGGQMRVGAAAATGDVVLLLHADTWLPAHGTRALLDSLRDRTVVAGGFWKEFREPPMLLLGSKWKCAVRFWLGRRIAGDQALFIRRDALERIGGIPDMALMEEFALCERLRREGRLALADAVVLTSARRFLKLGVVRTYLRMWWVSTRYRFGTSPSELRKIYERS